MKLSKKSFILMLIFTFLVILTVSTVVQAEVFGTPGSSNDPLVTKSYVDDLIESGVPVQVEPTAIITLAKGKTVLGNGGTEFVVRSGRALVVASRSGGLSDITSGKDLSDGVIVEKNHALIVPRTESPGRGLKADSTEVIIYVKGYYRVY